MRAAYSRRFSPGRKGLHGRDVLPALQDGQFFAGDAELIKIVGIHIDAERTGQSKGHLQADQLEDPFVEFSVRVGHEGFHDAGADRGFGIPGQESAGQKIAAGDPPGNPQTDSQIKGMFKGGSIKALMDHLP